MTNTFNNLNKIYIIIFFIFCIFANNLIADNELELCVKYYTEKQFEKAFPCFKYKYLNAETPKRASVYLTYMNYALFFNGEYEKTIENTIDYLVKYDTIYQYLFIVNIYLNALSHFKKIISHDRNVYPSGRQAFVHLELLYKNRDTQYKINRKIKEGVIYYFKSLIEIFIKNEEYIMNFYKRIGEANASRRREETYLKFKDYYLDLFKGEEEQNDNTTIRGGT